MRASIQYEIFHDSEMVKTIYIEKLWEIIESFESPIPEIFHLLYMEDGEWSGMKIKEIAEKIGLNAAAVSRREARGMRFLRHPAYRKRYTHKIDKIGVSLKDFSSEEILYELKQRLEKYEQS